jgi:hypothetical protein
MRSLNKRLGHACASALTLALLCGGSVVATAPLASAAAQDYDCDEEVGPVEDQPEPGPGQPVTVEGDRCDPVPGDPAEGIHIVSVYYGQDWVCQRVEETDEPGHIVGYGCFEADNSPA